jgi:hypothetical protein
MRRIMKPPRTLDMMMESYCRELLICDNGDGDVMVIIDGVTVLVYEVVNVVVAVGVST